MNQWRTAIGHPESDRIVVRGYDLVELIGNVGVGDMFALVMKGELPTPEEAKMIEAIFVTVVDHGISPSSTITRFLAASGTPIQVYVAGGLLSFGDIHGGAGEGLSRMLQESVRQARERGESLSAVAERIVTEHRERKEPLPGYGHPQHPEADPRPPRLIELARQWSVAGDHLQLALEMEAALETAVGRRLAMNLDGAIAAIISDMGFDWRVARLFLIVPRAVGLAAHGLEELDREGGWRQIPISEVSYDGPALRTLNGQRAPVPPA